MKQVFLGLGGNLGDVKNTLQHALDKIKALPSVYSVNISHLYETAPISTKKQNNFINCVCSIETTFAPRDLLLELQNIERSLGKYPKPKDAPRPIDIDILLYDDISMNTDDLSIPHPYLQERLFVLAPLSDLQKSVFLPNTGEQFDVIQAVELLMKQNKQQVIRLIERIS